CMQSTDLWTF
nr:immunoglobulin light chain junction region [Macaca mulatta]